MLSCPLGGTTPRQAPHSPLEDSSGTDSQSPTAVTCSLMGREVASFPSLSHFSTSQLVLPGLLSLKSWPWNVLVWGGVPASDKYLLAKESHHCVRASLIYWSVSLTVFNSSNVFFYFTSDPVIFMFQNMNVLSQRSHSAHNQMASYNSQASCSEVFYQMNYK